MYTYKIDLTYNHDQAPQQIHYSKNPIGKRYKLLEKSSSSHTGSYYLKTAGA
jgi:hypothetical protein